MLSSRTPNPKPFPRIGEGSRIPKKFEFLSGNAAISETLKDNARKNRRNPTIAESVLWDRLRCEALGVRFRRQHPIGDYITDFACIKKRLVIEVDGEYHFNVEQREEDEVRTDYINKQGYYVLRFRNEDVLNDIEYVITRIQEIIKKL